MQGTVWKIELLGSLSARRGERALTHFRTHQTGALLACLANSPNRVFRREELIDLFWPEHEPKSGQNCLRIALSHLRSHLEEEDEKNQVLFADRATVRLNPDAFTTDKAEFEYHLKAATHAECDEDRIAHLTRAAELYKGELLPGYDDEWAVGERMRLADSHLLGLRRLVKLHTTTRNFDAALDCARRAVAADPMREESHRDLMRLYYGMGRPAPALRQYQELERILREDLHTEPSPTTRELVALISSGVKQAVVEAPKAVRAARGGTALAEREGGEPVNVAFPFPSAPVSRPVLPSLSRKENLPASLTRFFGREDCMADIMEMLDTPETRLISLTGLGGNGKTRLAQAVAERLYEEYNGAVWFVQLAPLDDAGQIAEALFRALHIPRNPKLSALDQVVEALAARPGLLILDNFEHLIEGGALLVRTLLERAPHITILVTTRQRLNLMGEYEYAVPPLPTPQSPGTPERLMEFPSVQLFVDRALAVSPGFQVTTHNAASIASLCHHLEGVPLAIELAAAYADVLTPQKILARLSPRFKFLVNRNRDATPRHASLRAALDWSFDLLDPEVQRFFTRLSVFRGGWSLEAAEAVCQEPLAIDVIRQLRERSLITVEERDSEMRYILLETVREYADERLSDAERNEAVREHITFFQTLAGEAEQALCGPDAPAWFDQLAEEHDNLRAALDRALAAKEEGSREETASCAGLRLAASLWRFWYVRGYYEEGRACLKRAVQNYGQAPVGLRVKALRGAGNIAYALSDYAGAETLFERQRALSEENDDTPGLAAAYGSLGNVANDRGDFERARDLFTRALALFRELDDRRGISLTLANLGNLASDQGDYITARDRHQESLALFREAGDIYNVAVALNNMAQAVLYIGDYGTARRLLEESLALGRRLESRRVLAHALAECVTLAILQRSMAQAAFLMGALENLRKEVPGAQPAKALAEYAREKECVQAAMGERAFNHVWDQGRAMSLDQVLRRALEQVGEPLRD